MRFLILLFLAGCLQSFGQDLGVYVAFYDQRECEKILRKKFHVEDTLLYNSGDTLLAFFKGSNPLAVKLTFGAPNDRVPEYCIRQEIAFDCTECGIKYLYKLLHDKQYGWRIQEENKYMASFRMHVELSVLYTDPEHYCMTLLFNYVDKPTREFKDRYNTLVIPE